MDPERQKDAASRRRARLQPAKIGSRVVVLVGFNGVQTLDLVGPLDVFAKANARAVEREVPAPHYELIVASPDGGEIGSEAGIRLAGTVRLAEVGRPPDTIVVAGGSEDALIRARDETDLVAWIAASARRTRRVASVCTGAFVLAAAGLLDGRRVTTHWSACGRLQSFCPMAEVVPDAIYVSDRGIYTSAGFTAGIDLALALVEQDLGSEVALAVARDLVLFLRRPGGQAQFSASLAAQAHAGDRFRELAVWIRENPTGDLRVPALAARAAMSERNFGRAFAAQTGVSPARYVELARLDQAKLLLESSDWPLARVAERSGFGSVPTLLRAFRRHLSVTPEEYRERFRL